MVTEKEVWLNIAKDWDNAVGYFPYKWNSDIVPYKILYRVNDGQNGGLCPCIKFSGAPFNIIVNMEKKLKTYAPKKELTSLGHLWPTNKKGAIKRAAFCRRMAKLCD